MVCNRRLSIVTWNVNGLSEKLKDDEFIRIISNNDMICLTETWTSVQSNIKLKGYKSVHRIRHKHRRKGRRSGGIIFYYHKRLSIGIKEIPKTHEDLLWLKLDSNFFGFKNDLYLCVTYLKPHAINTQNSACLQLEKDICRFSKCGQIVLSGDFNARTGIMNDFVINDDIDKYIDTGNDYSVDSLKYNRSRQNMDGKLNSQGRALLDLCKAAGLRIINGRKMGDLLGEYTCIKPNGKSVVDYFIMSKELMSYCQYIQIGDITYLSDHTPVKTLLKCNIDIGMEKCESTPLKKIYNRFI